MLVLCRTQGEFICIGDDIQITLVIVRQGIVRLGLGLPDDVNHSSKGGLAENDSNK